jgi:hypothetical protein
MTIKTKVPERYGCPICGFRNENEDAIIEHMLDTADKKNLRGVIAQLLLVMKN